MEILIALGIVAALLGFFICMGNESESDKSPSRKATKDVYRRNYKGQRYKVQKFTDDHLLTPWIYKNRKIHSKPIWTNKVGFVYEIEFNNGKKYIGKRAFDRHGDWKFYIGSGTRVKQMVERNNSKASIVKSRKIISMHDDFQKLKHAEIREQKKRRVVESNQYLNLIYGDR